MAIMKKTGKRILASLCALLIASWSYAPTTQSARIKTSLTASAAEAPSADNGFVVIDGGTASDNSKFYSSRIVRSYLVENKDGTLSRIEYNNDNVIVETYDKDGSVVGKTKKIALEFPKFGGFYKGSNAYYLVEGKDNTDEDDSAEVISVIKYDFNWKRLGSAELVGDSAFAHEIRYPFDSFCVEMTEADGILYVATAHEGYIDPQYGQGHTGFLMVRVDETEMTATIADADLWHSFAQYMENDGENIYILEQSEGSRYTKLSKASVSVGKRTSPAPIFRYGGTHTSAWSIACFATADDLALSENNVICAGTSIDQANYENGRNEPYNIYITVTPKDSITEDDTTVKWLTDHTERVYFSRVRLNRISDDRIIATWWENKTVDSKSVYTSKVAVLDGNGDPVYDIIEYEGNILSECKPILCKDGMLRWYAASNGSLRLYTLDPESPNVSLKDIADAVITPGSGEYNFGSEVTAEAEVVYNGSKLTEGVDYTITYSNNINVADKSKMTINGIGGFTGKKTVPFSIEPMDINSVKYISSGSQYTYTGSPIEAAVSIVSSYDIVYNEEKETYTYKTNYLTADVDYTVSYKNNTDITDKAEIIIKGKGNYKGTVTKNFEITPRSISSYNIKLSYDPTVHSYTGKAQKPKVILTDTANDDKVLKQGTDFDVEFADNINKGSASVTITGKGNYTGSRSGSFYISAKSISDEDVEVTLDREVFNYDGTAKEPAVKITYNGKTLVKDTDYTVSYYNNTSKGSKAYAIIYGTGNYSGSIKKFFTIEELAGDVNNDGEFNISDVVLLQKWLLSASDTELANWKAADLNKDNKLNVFDLILMKRALFSKK